MHQRRKNMKTNQALTQDKNQKVQNAKEKKAVLKGIAYNAANLKFNAVDDLKAVLSQVYATMDKVHEMYERTSKELTFIQKDIDDIKGKEELEKADIEKIDELESQKNKWRALLKAYTKVTLQNRKEILDIIEEETYSAYKCRFDDESGFYTSIYTCIYNHYGQKLDDTVLRFIGQNVGSQLANVKNWGTSLINDTKGQQYACMVLYCLIQVAIDKKQLNMKIIDKTFDEIERIAENCYSGYTAIQIPSRVSKTWYKNALKENCLYIETKKVPFGKNGVPTEKTLNAMTFNEIEKYFYACVNANKFVSTYH